VAWHRWDEVDIAVLEIIGSGWVAPVWRHPVRWGQLVTTRRSTPCRLARGEGMTDSPHQPVHTRETGLEHAPDHPRRPQEQTPTPFSAIKSMHRPTSASRTSGRYAVGLPADP
jgi:hypothetical protein